MPAKRPMGQIYDEGVLIDSDGLDRAYIFWTIMIPQGLFFFVRRLMVCPR